MKERRRNKEGFMEIGKKIRQFSFYPIYIRPKSCDQREKEEKSRFLVGDLERSCRLQACGDSEV